MDMSENTFLVLQHEPGGFIVTPWPSSVPPSGPPWGLVSSDQVFRGTEEQTRGFLAEKGQPSSQIKTLIRRARLIKGRFHGG
jgi:hypothetical protein